MCPYRALLNAKSTLKVSQQVEGEGPGSMRQEDTRRWNSRESSTREDTVRGGCRVTCEMYLGVFGGVYFLGGSVWGWGLFV